MVLRVGIFPPASISGFGSPPLVLRDIGVGDNRLEFGARNRLLVSGILNVSGDALTQAS